MSKNYKILRILITRRNSIKKDIELATQYKRAY